MADIPRWNAVSIPSGIHPSRGELTAKYRNNAANVATEMAPIGCRAITPLTREPRAGAGAISAITHGLYVFRPRLTPESLTRPCDTLPMKSLSDCPPNLGHLVAVTPRSRAVTSAPGISV